MRGEPRGDLGEGVLGGVNSMCKGPGEGPRLACWKKREEACMAGAEGGVSEEFRAGRGQGQVPQGLVRFGCCCF